MRRASGSLHVFTFKDGALARVAHDLRLRMESFSIEFDGAQVRAEFDLRSLLVDGPIQNGQLDSSVYDAAKRAEIETILRRDILQTRQHPLATFTGIAEPRGMDLKVRGELCLRGNSAPLSFDVKQEGDLYRCELTLQPSRWGVSPYKALLGAIRLKDFLRVEVILKEIL